MAYVASAESASSPRLIGYASANASVIVGDDVALVVATTAATDGGAEDARRAEAVRARTTDQVGARSVGSTRHARAPLTRISNGLLSVVPRKLVLVVLAFPVRLQLDAPGGVCQVTPVPFAVSAWPLVEPPALNFAELTCPSPSFAVVTAPSASRSC